MIIFSWAHSRKKLARLPSDATITTCHDNFHWVCLNRHHTSLFGYKAPDWSDLGDEEHAVLVKANPLRRVYHIHSQDYDLHAKVIKPASFKDRLKWLIRSCPSRIEFENLQIARARSVPVIMPIAWALSSDKRNPYGILVTQTIKSAYRFDELLWQEDRANPQIIVNALIAAAHAVGRLHCGCIQHLDLHPGNLILVPPSTDDEENAGDNVINDIPKAYISDLQNIRIEHKGGHASADPFSRWRIANVGMLLNGIRKKTTVQQQRIFVMEYLRTIQPHLQWSSDKFENYFKQLLLWADRQDKKNVHSRDRRVLKDSKYFQQIKLGSGWYARIFLKAKRPKSEIPASQCKFTEVQWRDALSDPMTLLQTGRILKQGGHNTIIAQNLTIGDKQLPVVVKHTRLRKGLRGFWQAVRRSRALRHWHRAYELINRNIPTPWPLAALEHYKGPMLSESIYICSKIPYSLNLKQIIKQNKIPQAFRQRIKLTEQVAALLARLEVNGFRHRDCKASNIVIEHPPKEDLTWKAYLVDLDGIRLRKYKIEGVGHEAIVRLGASCWQAGGVRRTDYVRVFNRYIKYLKMPESRNRLSRHALWNEMVGRAQEKAKREEGMSGGETGGKADENA